jgi:hypothetical protein
LKELVCAEPDNAKVLRLKEIKYNFGRDKIISFCDDMSDTFSLDNPPAR